MKVHEYYKEVTTSKHQQVDSKTDNPKEKQRLNESRSSSIKKRQIDSSINDKNPFICRFCGGKSCKLEDWKQVTRPAIRGLNSNWINSDIVASQRPSSRLIKEFNIVDQFKQAKIGAVINLQEPGEHQHCGDGIIEKTGFSYDFEEFQKRK